MGNINTILLGYTNLLEENRKLKLSNKLLIDKINILDNEMKQLKINTNLELESVEEIEKKLKLSIEKMVDDL